MLLMCSPFPTFCSAHPPYFFFSFRVQLTTLPRPLCCPMKTPLKCFPVKMFSTQPLLAFPTPKFYRLPSSSLSVPTSFSLLLILPSPSPVHIRICYPIMAWDLHHPQLSFYRFVFGSLGRSLSICSLRHQHAFARWIPSDRDGSTSNCEGISGRYTVCESTRCCDYGNTSQ